MDVPKHDRGKQELTLLGALFLHCIPLPEGMAPPALDDDCSSSHAHPHCMILSLRYLQIHGTT